MVRKIKVDRYTRQNNFVTQLAAYAPKITKENMVELVLHLVRKHQIDGIDFMKLDEKPGYWGYNIDGNEWHCYLRRVRNSCSELFKVLEENEKENEDAR